MKRIAAIQHLGKVKKICEKCKKIYKEAAKPLTLFKTSNVDDNGKCDRIEEEFIPYCAKCFKAEIKRYKKAQWLTTMIQAKFIGKEVLLKHRNNELSNKELDELWRDFQKCQ